MKREKKDKLPQLHLLPDCSALHQHDTLVLGTQKAGGTNNMPLKYADNARTHLHMHMHNEKE